MSDPLPDRVSMDRASAFFNYRFRKIGIRFDGKVLFNVAEYCVSQGWIKRLVPAGRGYKQERGRPISVLVRGKVEPYWRT